MSSIDLKHDIHVEEQLKRLRELTAAASLVSSGTVINSDTIPERAVFEDGLRGVSDELQRVILEYARRIQDVASSHSLNERKRQWTMDEVDRG